MANIQQEQLRCSDTTAGKENSQCKEQRGSSGTTLGATELQAQGAATAQLGCSRFSLAEDSGSQV